MHVFSHRARRRFMQRFAYQMAKPSMRPWLWTAGISAAGSLLYMAMRKRRS